MALSDRAIRRLLDSGKLVITPKPGEDRINAASIDLSLSDEFWLFKEGIVLSQETNWLDVTTKTKCAKRVLLPGEMILGMTKEKISMPPDLIGELEGRSTFARLGIAVHITSNLVQPGSNNRQLLEIYNFSPNPFELRAGMRICQIMFSKLEGGATTKPYAKCGKIAVKQ